MELKYVLLFLAAVYPETIGLRCLSCQGVFEPKYCIQTIQCVAGEHCYTEQVIDDNLNVFYNVGCKSSQLCKVAVQEGFGKRSGQLHVCEKCCDTDKCNNVSCTHPQGTPTHNCLRCPDVASPLECKTLGECAMDEMCFTQEFVNAKLERRYSLGCEKTKRCELLDQLVPHQRSTQLCNQCCQSANCNKYLCTDSNTNVAQTIDPAKTKLTTVPAIQVPLTPSFTKSPPTTAGKPCTDSVIINCMDLNATGTLCTPNSPAAATYCPKFCKLC
ncbi:uncharacterized protein LOC127729243 [Mytilus californianus]|uniref:uncharacterized protein LOC127729243 n=1 Tax=Mytilus californianus TaxID=6549 RepID=UPI00224679C3|nr:uncharacterized protein LOC127729243 [Mytilus californianus]